MASKDQRWKTNRSKLFFVGFGLLTCLAKYLNLKENSPCFLLLFVFSFSRCTIPIWNAQLLWKLGLTLHQCQLASIKYTQALTDYRVFRWHSSKKISGISHFGNCRTAPPPAGGRRVGNLHSGEKDFLNFSFKLETAGPGGQVTRWIRRTRWSRWPGGQDVHSKENPTFVGWPRWPRLHLGSSKNSLFVPVSDFERLR